MEEKYISDVINLNNLDTKCFNLVYSFCGTGKTYFVGNHLLHYLGDVKPQEIIFVTSRSMIVEQQARINDQNICKFNPRNMDIIRSWNGESDIPTDMLDEGIQTMTIDKLIYMIMHCGSYDTETLEKAKVFIFDECHMLFSDMFIRGMDILHLWIYLQIKRGDKIFIGLTATPNILIQAERDWSVRINLLNEEPLMHYKVRNLYCTRFNELEQIAKDPRFTGKTMIMCYSVNNCFELQRYFPNSAVLISPSNKKYIPEEMDSVRDYIVENETLPDTFMRDGKITPLDTLITTSTMREGVNLREESGIRNVICCIPDELHITQFAGRCRFDIENLIVVYQCIHREKYQNQYLYDKRMEFREFMNNPEDRMWFDTIKHLLVDPTKSPEILHYQHSYLETCIDNRFLECKIYLDEDKDYIIQQAKKDKIFNLPNQCYTFNRIMRYLEDSGKYTIKTTRIYENDRTYSAKIIIKNIS